MFHPTRSTPGRFLYFWLGRYLLNIRWIFVDYWMRKKGKLNKKRITLVLGGTNTNTNTNTNTRRMVRWFTEWILSRVDSLYLPSGISSSASWELWLIRRTCNNSFYNTNVYLRQIQIEMMTNTCVYWDKYKYKWWQIPGWNRACWGETSECSWAGSGGTGFDCFIIWTCLFYYFDLIVSLFWFDCFIIWIWLFHYLYSIVLLFGYDCFIIWIFY